MIEDYHFIYSQWNGLLHICLPEPPSAGTPVSKGFAEWL